MRGAGTNVTVFTHIITCFFSFYTLDETTKCGPTDLQVIGLRLDRDDLQLTDASEISSPSTDRNTPMMTRDSASINCLLNQVPRITGINSKYTPR